MNWFRVAIFVTCLICLDASNIREGRITGGREAEPHSNPYVVSLQSRFFSRRYRICSGSILSKRWILSSGHCVTDSFARRHPMDAIVGAHNLAYLMSSQIYPLSHRIAHPMYRGGVGPYDIAMMRTSRDIEFSREAQPISLPLMPPRDETTRNNNLLITGWGALQSTYFYTVLPNKLQEARVSYLPYSDCYYAVNKLKDYHEPNPLKRIHNLCTGPISGGISGCTGDSGGPLVQYVPMMPSATDPSPSTTGKEETTTASSPMSPTPMTTDRTTTTSSTTSSPTPMSTDRTSTSTQSTTSPIPMTTDRNMTTSTASPTPVSTSSMSSTSEMDINTSSSTMDSTTMEYDWTASSDELNIVAQLSRNGIDINKYDAEYELQDRSMRADMMPMVIGVISWGVVPCGKRGAPTVYSNVSNYMDFINEYLTSTYY